MTVFNRHCVEVIMNQLDLSVAMGLEQMVKLETSNQQDNYGIDQNSPDVIKSREEWGRVAEVAVCKYLFTETHPISRTDCVSFPDVRKWIYRGVPWFWTAYHYKTRDVAHSIEVKSTSPGYNLRVPLDQIRESVRLDAQLNRFTPYVLVAVNGMGKSHPLTDQDPVRVWIQGWEYAGNILVHGEKIKSKQGTEQMQISLQNLQHPRRLLGMVPRLVAQMDNTEWYRKNKGWRNLRQIPGRIKEGQNAG